MPCVKTEEIKTLSEKYEEVSDFMREIRIELKTINKKIDDNQEINRLKFEEIKPEFQAVADIKTFFRIGKSFGAWASFLIITISVVLGAIYSFKEWVNR